MATTNYYQPNLAYPQFAGQDPNQIIQQMLNSGKITQEQYNAAVARYQQMQQMFGK